MKKKPISSAPKDGSHILLFIDDTWIEGWWDKQEYTNKQGNYGPGEWDVASLMSHGCGCCSEANGQPTYWLPLPK